MRPDISLHLTKVLLVDRQYRLFCPLNKTLRVLDERIESDDLDWLENTFQSSDFCKMNQDLDGGESGTSISLTAAPLVRPARPSESRKDRLSFYFFLFYGLFTIAS